MKDAADAGKDAKAGDKRAAGEEADDQKASKKRKTTEKKEKKEKKPKKEIVHTLNINGALDKAHENKPLREVIKLPPSALQGLAEKADEIFARYGMKTIEDMANWKFYNYAVAINDLTKYEHKGERDASSRQNITKAVDQEHLKSSLKDLVKAPLSAFKGLTKEANEHFSPLGACRTIGELAKWKYFNMAAAITQLAACEGDMTDAAGGGGGAK